MLSIFARRQQNHGIQRQEVVVALAEVGAIFTIFIIAFTGRGVFGDGVRQLLIVLSLLAGALGTLAGGWVLMRGVKYPSSRLARLAMGGVMSFIGIYTIVHVL